MGRTIDETVERERREKLGMRRKKKLPMEKLRCYSNATSVFLHNLFRTLSRAEFGEK